MEFEETLAESLGTRVQIEKKKIGGKLVIDFFTNDDIKKIIGILKNEVAVENNANVILNNFEKNNPDYIKNQREEILNENNDTFAATQAEEDEELYSLKDFSL